MRKILAILNFYEINIVAIDLDRHFRTTANMFGIEDALPVTCPLKQTRSDIHEQTCGTRVQ